MATVVKNSRGPPRDHSYPEMFMKDANCLHDWADSGFDDSHSLDVVVFAN